MNDAPEILSPRPVPLGGIRALPVRRTLPQRGRTLIGAWCFLDHYGPTLLSSDNGMSVPRHPHTGLQTVSWLFAGAIDHCDSAGHQVRVEPGEVNLMTSGHGITHSEFATADTTQLHGVQLWLALPESQLYTAPGLHHYAPPTVHGKNWSARVALGELFGSRSPVPTHTPTLLAELTLDPNTTHIIDAAQGTHTSFEYGILVDQGNLNVNGQQVSATELAYIETGTSQIRLEAGTTGTRIMLIGGTPLNEPLVMWWNFVGRTHNDIVTARTEYMQEISHPTNVHTGERFGPFPADTPAALPAPPLPQTRLLARR